MLFFPLRSCRVQHQPVARRDAHWRIGFVVVLKMKTSGCLQY
jgi:hypothetical protein